MQVSKIQNHLNFKGATLNFNVLADTHGHIKACDSAYKTMSDHKKDIFEKEENGKKNYFIIGGDWFISGETKGFLTDPKKPFIWFQKTMLDKFIKQTEKICPDMETLFIPGNHDLDCGISLFSDSMEDFDGTILMSNIDIKNSSAFKSLTDNNKLVTSKIDFVQDDKDNKKFHPVLNLGVAPVNLEYYVSCDGIKLYDNNKLSQSQVNKPQYQKTLDKIQEEIKDFKKQYETGTVVLTCHVGRGFADECAKNGNIDLIFDGHEHKDETRFVNNTPIVALSQNFKKLVNAKIKIDDSNNKEILIKELRPDTKSTSQGELAKFYEKLFEKDSKKIFKIRTKSNDIASLDLNGVRYRNNHLANFICDVILSGIKEKEPSVQIFALNSSAIRGGLSVGCEPKNSMFDILCCLNGISEEQSEIMVNKVTGAELALMVKDNIEYNNKNKERNPIIQYSGISIDRSAVTKALNKEENLDELCRYITLEETGEKINPNQTYKIANPKKYFIKTQNPKIKSMQETAYPLNLNARKLFVDYFQTHENISYEPKTRFY